MPESVLVRIYLVYQLGEQGAPQITAVQLEQLVKQITTTWSDNFAETALQTMPETEALTLARRFKQAFSSAYVEQYSPQQALKHIELFDGLNDASELAIDLKHQDQAGNNGLQLALFHRDSALELSDMIPMLENLGFRVVIEHPYLIQPDRQTQVWLQEFYLSFSLDVDVDVSAVQSSFKEALSTVWKGDAENDSFN